MSTLMSCVVKQMDEFSLWIHRKKIISLCRLRTCVVVIPHMTAVLKDLLHVVALFSFGVDDNSRGGIFHLRENTKRGKWSF